jgi:hypothetical protein
VGIHLPSLHQPSNLLKEFKMRKSATVADGATHLRCVTITKAVEVDSYGEQTQGGIEA